MQCATAADNEGVSSLSWLNTHGKVALKLPATAQQEVSQLTRHTPQQKMQHSARSSATAALELGEKCTRRVKSVHDSPHHVRMQLANTLSRLSSLSLISPPAGNITPPPTKTPSTLSSPTLPHLSSLSLMFLLVTNLPSLPAKGDVFT